MAIFRITAEWTGFPGAPGYSTFHFQGSSPGSGAEGERSRVRAFFAAFSQDLAGGTTITVLPTIQVYDEATGMMTGLIDDTTTLTPVAAPTTGNYAGPSGGMVQWNTGTVVNGRLLRGRTFLVPLGTTAYDNTGTLATATIGRINTGASELSGAGFASGFGVWSRPQSGGTGAFAEVNGHRVPDKVVVLRSRRD